MDNNQNQVDTFDSQRDILRVNIKNYINSSDQDTANEWLNHIKENFEQMDWKEAYSIIDEFRETDKEKLGRVFNLLHRKDVSDILKMSLKNYNEGLDKSVWLNYIENLIDNMQKQDVKEIVNNMDENIIDEALKVVINKKFPDLISDNKEEKDVNDDEIIDEVVIDTDNKQIDNSSNDSFKNDFYLTKRDNVNLETQLTQGISHMKTAIKYSHNLKNKALYEERLKKYEYELAKLKDQKGKKPEEKSTAPEKIEPVAETPAIEPAAETPVVETMEQSSKEEQVQEPYIQVGDKIVRVIPNGDGHARLSEQDIEAMNQKQEENVINNESVTPNNSPSDLAPEKNSNNEYTAWLKERRTQVSDNLSSQLDNTRREAYERILKGIDSSLGTLADEEIINSSGKTR